MNERTAIDETSVPRLPRGVRLKFDKPRDQWVLLAPERMFVLDAVAHAIVKDCDGEKTVASIVDNLESLYEAPRNAILTDVIALLQDFADKGVIAA